MNEPIHVTDANFENAVLKSSLPVVVDFWAPWCGPCRMVLPMMEEIAKEYADKIIVAKVNTDEIVPIRSPLTSAETRVPWLRTFRTRIGIPCRRTSGATCA